MKLDTYTQKSIQGALKTNMRLKPIKLIEENIGKNLHDTGLGSDFLNMKPELQVTRAKLGKCDYIKLKRCPVMKTID